MAFRGAPSLVRQPNISRRQRRTRRGHRPGEPFEGYPRFGGRLPGVVLNLGIKKTSRMPT